MCLHLLVYLKNLFIYLSGFGQVEQMKGPSSSGWLKVAQRSLAAVLFAGGCSTDVVDVCMSTTRSAVSAWFH